MCSRREDVTKGAGKGHKMCKIMGRALESALTQETIPFSKHVIS